jgi:thioredoxin reductase
MSERVSDPFDTLVIGGGIAGLTAALFATRSGCSTLVLVPGIPGGQPRRARHRDLKRGRSRAHE